MKLGNFDIRLCPDFLIIFKSMIDKSLIYFNN